MEKETLEQLKELEELKGLDGDGKGLDLLDEMEKGKGSRSEEEVSSFPHLVFIELIAILAVTAFFFIVSILFNAPLEDVANPFETPNPAKAPWYFVGLQELLVYFDPWIGGVVVPTLIIIGLMAIPYLYRRGAGAAAAGSRPGRFGIAIFMSGLALWFGLILIGLFFRGPSWQIFWPWAQQAAAKTSPDSSFSLPFPVGLGLLSAFLAAGYVLPLLLWKGLYSKLGFVRYAVSVMLFMLMVGLFAKILLRLAFNLKYILATPWFNI